MSARISRRFFAYCMDFMVVFFLVQAVWVASESMVYLFEWPFELRRYVLSSLQEMEWPLLIGGLMAYFFHANYFMEGKSLGGLFFDLVAREKGGQALSAKQSLARSAVLGLLPLVLSHIISSFLLLIPFVRKDKRGLADILSFSQSYEGDIPLFPRVETIPPVLTEVPSPSSEDRELPEEREEEEEKKAA
ncbi:MAG: RDD family protein [Bacteriovoracales bacterium]|nr:RDD family protein [Bacteriovoracales bacterium]